VPFEAPLPKPKPHEIQRQALAALEQTRDEGFTAGLVVLATGLGKTWLAAFDADRPEFRRILFVAHREEILNQAVDTFRRIRPSAHIGRLASEQREIDADLVFASVQTLGRVNHLARVDYSNIPWRNSQFDLAELTARVATEVRARNALEQFRKHGGRRCIAFCCSQRHAVSWPTSSCAKA
jgi:superfamily II DNA or RNA helicase